MQSALPSRNLQNRLRLVVEPKGKEAVSNSKLEFETALFYEQLTVIQNLDRFELGSPDESELIDAFDLGK